MDRCISICVPVKYLIVLSQTSRALRNTNLAGLQATRVRLDEREKLRERVSGGGGIKRQTDGWWSSTDNQEKSQIKKHK